MKSSVVIPTYNQSQSLRYVLEGFCHQSFKEFEVIVVDDGSKEDIASVVEQFATSLYIQLIKLEKNSGRSTARNKGIQAAKGEILIFNDSDRIPGHSFVSSHVQSHQEQAKLICVGEVRELYFSDLERVEKLLLNEIQSNFKKYHRLSRKPSFIKVIDHLYKDGNNRSHIPWLSFLVGNLSIRKEWLIEDLFDPNFIKWGFEHMELGYRLYQKNLAYIQSAESVNYHLAHSRSESYENLIKKSHEYFYSKHKVEVVEKLIDFIFGRIALREFDALVTGESELDADIYYPTIKDNKII